MRVILSEAKDRAALRSGSDVMTSSDAILRCAQDDTLLFLPPFRPTALPPYRPLASMARGRLYRPPAFSTAAPNSLYADASTSRNGIAR